MKARSAILVTLLGLGSIPFVILGAMQVPSWLEYRRLRAEFETHEIRPARPTDDQIQRGESLLMLADEVRPDWESREKASEIASRAEALPSVKWAELSAEMPLTIVAALPRIVAMREILLAAPPPALPARTPGRFGAMYAPDDLPLLLQAAAILHAGGGDHASAMRDVEAAWRLSQCVPGDGPPRGEARGARIACTLLPRLEGSESVTWLDDSPAEPIIEAQRAEIREILDSAQRGEFEEQSGCIVRTPPRFLLLYRARLRRAWCHEARMALDDLRAIEEQARCGDVPSERNHVPPDWLTDIDTVLMGHVENHRVLKIQMLRTRIDFTRATLAWRARWTPDGVWPEDFDPSGFSRCPDVAFTLDVATPDRIVLRAAPRDHGVLWAEMFGPLDFAFEPPRPASLHH